MVSTLADGRTLFKVFLPHAASVQVVGTFTNWRAEPIKLERQDAGWWTTTSTIPAGEHEFSYLVDHSIWLADYAAHGVKLASSGQWVSSLRIKAESGVGSAAPVRMAV